MSLWIPKVSYKSITTRLRSLASSRHKATMAPKFSKEDSDLVAELHRLSISQPKLVKSSTYTAPADPNTTIRSWKMNEFKYYDIPSPFPTLARGLFTTEWPIDETNGEKKYQIVVRGYDKFFNIGEVPWTKWSSLEARTSAPYTLTLKSNGCIIFIGALSPSKLVVTSKHSLGPGGDPAKSHAMVGEKWLDRHLATKNKTKEQLAAILWEKNWTAIAELCDDDFEEHVLPYPPDQSGLYLHGINESTKLFKTLPPATVDAFAEEWGFITTKSLVMDSIPEVKAFTDEISKTGMWNGEAIEGFVVRTHVVDPPKRVSAESASPYAAGSTFFFKVKFDEPYLMYRDWREVTKKLLSAKGPVDQVTLPRKKMQRAETAVYVKWAKEEIKRNPAAFSEYTKNKGIISTREKFLKWLASEEGKKGLKSGAIDTGEVVKSKAKEGKTFGKTIIVPIAIPGCGKTSVGVALAHLYGFGHTQSDDVHARKPAPIFINNVADLLKRHDVVIADKNNHLRQHRDQLRKATANMSPPVRLLAWNWSIDEPPATVHRIMSDRVLTRGDNHQTLRADATKSHEEVIWMFLNQIEELEHDEVDDIVEMDIEDTLEQAVSKAIDGCVAVLGLERPRQEKIEEALQVATGYAPKTKKAADAKKDGKGTPRYFGLLPEVDLKELLAPFMSAAEDGSWLWEHLVAQERITGRPHVTIVHKNSLPAEGELWERCTGLHRMQSPPLFKFKLGHVVWNKRVMAVTVDDIEVDSTITSEDPSQEGHEFVSKLPHDVRDRLHITVGTKDSKILPVEGMHLVQEWKRGLNADDINSIALNDAVAVGRIKGLFS